ncbi:hypothetical protein BDZ90DRAFT_229164 [Jaminaea rosea]|uniref:Transcription initiation factor TFIID subunit 13 n=1 Tax=Jaminaea rosea TaxID=1569628 RepID=A0A316UYR6_9BASI|nr:hypothetical protein BDZ90DRAFT_229164 [Jaminaea rosea]PWN30134.1 hypothetical protein BDZ90DRAFT_229164 [Jaminaea rosea]
MYGFGDSPQPDPRSIDVMERLTISFLVDLCHRCRPAPYAHPSSSNPARNPYLTRSRVKIDDLRFALRKDDKKLARLEELIYLDGIISGAKKILDTGAIDDVARQVEAEERQKRGGAGDDEEGEDQQQAQGGEGEAREEEHGLQLPGGSGRGRGGGGEEGERGAQRGGGPGRKRKRGAAV